MIIYGGLAIDGRAMRDMHKFSTSMDCSVGNFIFISLIETGAWSEVVQKGTPPAPCYSHAVALHADNMCVYPCLHSRKIAMIILGTQQERTMLGFICLI